MLGRVHSGSGDLVTPLDGSLEGSPREPSVRYGSVCF